MQFKRLLPVSILFLLYINSVLAQPTGFLRKLSDGIFDIFGIYGPGTGMQLLIDGILLVGLVTLLFLMGASNGLKAIKLEEFKTRLAIIFGFMGGLGLTLLIQKNSYTLLDIAGKIGLLFLLLFMYILISILIFKSVSKKHQNTALVFIIAIGYAIFSMWLYSYEFIQNWINEDGAIQFFLWLLFIVSWIIITIGFIALIVYLFKYSFGLIGIPDSEEAILDQDFKTAAKESRKARKIRLREARKLQTAKNIAKELMTILAGKRQNELTGWVRNPSWLPTARSKIEKIENLNLKIEAYAGLLTHSLEYIEELNDPVIKTELRVRAGVARGEIIALIKVISEQIKKLVEIAHSNNWVEAPQIAKDFDNALADLSKWSDAVEAIHYRVMRHLRKGIRKASVTPP